MLDGPHPELPGPPAGFWRRWAAALVDGIVLGIVSTIAQFAFGTQAGYGIGIVAALAYFTYFHGRTGQTPGNAAFAIRVLDVRDRIGQPIGYPRALGRWAISYVSGIVLLLGYLWMLWDPQKQTWHDKAVGSLPVYVGR